METTAGMGGHRYRDKQLCQGSKEAEEQLVLWTMGPTEESQVLH